MVNNDDDKGWSEIVRRTLVKHFCYNLNLQKRKEKLLMFRFNLIVYNLKLEEKMAQVMQLSEKTLVVPQKGFMNVILENKKQNTWF